MATQTRSTLLQSLHRRLLEARANSDALFEIVREDSLYERPIAERHRIIFYLGHLEAFDWNLLREHLFSRPSATPAFDRLFAFGIDPVDGGLPSDQPKDWPSVSEVREYVQSLRARIDEGLDSGNFAAHSQADASSAETLLHTALEHRLMHAETLAYMFHQLPYANKISQPQAEVRAASVQNVLVEIPPGQATLGQPRDGSRFGWDNEFEATTVAVPGFRIQKYMVTNGEYLQFVEDGGYYNPQFWSAPDWEWKERNLIRHPAFWKQTDSGWSYRGMFEEIPQEENWPVYTSHAEASAYARWSHQSLPTEAQWHRAAYATDDATEREFPWGSGTPSRALGNFDFLRWDPTPVNAYPANQSAFGVAGLLGNGWEWTSTPFSGLPGFQAYAFYPGYSANFFDNQHYVIKGGSCRTAACLLRRSFRNWFQPHYQYVYAGFRCVSQ